MGLLLPVAGVGDSSKTIIEFLLRCQGGGAGVISCGNVEKVWWVGQQLATREDYLNGREDLRNSKGQPLAPTRGRYANIGFKLPGRNSPRAGGRGAPGQQQTLEAIPSRLSSVTMSDESVTLATRDGTRKNVDFLIVAIGITPDFSLYQFGLPGEDQQRLVTNEATVVRPDLPARSDASAFSLVQGKQLRIRDEPLNIFFVGTCKPAPKSTRPAMEIDNGGLLQALVEERTSWIRHSKTESSHVTPRPRGYSRSPRTSSRSSPWAPSPKAPLVLSPAPCRGLKPLLLRALAPPHCCQARPPLLGQRCGLCWRSRRCLTSGERRPSCSGRWLT